ncbi:DNA methyltransferase [Brucella endophytica]|uniref:site-specific DNA-methyltransferase (adenine-specific) n=1 Tax=Brucella endophytica TaxID=1963359 RepID=A0A916SJA0_9HYPH|nr:DNA adenine methylase [Brucella endophytica]GGB02226.1 DNA methyltransferase [Brucella endophytica]
MLNRFSPLRYPGGKGKLAEYVQAIFNQNNLNDGHYVEPYAGGAGVALALLFTGNASRVHINDLNTAVYAFWHSVLNNTDEFCRKVWDTEISVEEWNKQKLILRNPNDNSSIDVGYAMFFLNRTNRSGVINAGIIGGKNQTGKWKIDARYNKKELVERIERITSFNTKISLYNLDACALIERIQDIIPKKSLIYFDPPYYMKGDRLYENHYKADDHAALGKFIQEKVQRPWIVSYDNVAQIREIYRERRQKIYEIGYSVRKVYNGSEVIVFSDDISVPVIENPLKISA